MIAIYQTEEAASKLLAASPLHFIVDPPPLQGPVTSAASFGISQVFGTTSNITNTPGPNDAEQTADNPSTAPLSLGAKAREFHLTADVSFADQQAHLERQEYYWGFVRNRSFAEEDLARSVPLEGLATVSVTPHQLPSRIVRYRAAEVAARKTLRQLWEEGNTEAPNPEASRSTTANSSDNTEAV